MMKRKKKQNMIKIKKKQNTIESSSNLKAICLGREYPVGLFLTLTIELPLGPMGNS